MTTQVIAGDDLIVIGRDTQRCEACGNSWTIKGRPKTSYEEGTSTKYARPRTVNSRDQRPVAALAAWCSDACYRKVHP